MPPRLEPGSVVAGRFEIEALAAAGGMASVYRCRDRVAGCAAALKVQPAALLSDWRRFEREAQLLAELRHPGVVRYVAHGLLDPGDLWIAMEWLEGESLEARLAQGPLSVPEAVRLASLIAEVLVPVHARGVVHRDLKPSNLFLAGGRLESLKLIDFGIAGLRRGAAITQSGAILGTPGYMAPEQARSEGNVDPRADLFSLGCVLHACLAGGPPFRGEDPMAVLAKIVLEDAPPLAPLRPDAPASLCALVARLLSRDREGRPADAAAFLAELSSLAMDGAPQPPLAPALTSAEQRLLCVALIDRTRALPRTGEPPRAAPEIRRVVEAHQGRLEELATGALVATWSGGSAGDQAESAARCAQALRPLLPDARIALATGRGVALVRSWAGEAIDRAVRLLRQAPQPGVVLDEVTEQLLAGRYQLRAETGSFKPVRAAESPLARNTLLGQPTSCIGRDRELDALGALWSESAGDPLARAVLVIAPAGTGKSRLAAELIERLRQRTDAPQIWCGRSDPLRAGSPFGLLSSAIRNALGVHAGEPPEARARKVRERMAQLLPPGDAARVAGHLTELLGVRRQQGATDRQLLGDQLRRAFEEWVAAECARRPVLLVLEDLHWGDLPTVKFIDAALREDRPLMVLGLARPEVHATFPGLWEGRRLEEMRLGPLSPRSSARLAREALGESAGAAAIERIVSLGAGHALHLEELIRAAAEGREGPPQTVLAMLHARLEQLDPQARQVLRAASVFGQRFWAGGVASLLRGAPVGARLALLGEQEVIVRGESSRFPGEEEHAFRHALVRETAYAMLTEADRALGHRLARQWLSQHGETEALVLAEHCERGGEPEQAVGYWQRAAEQALEGDDIDAALARVRRALDCRPEGETLGALLLLGADAHSWKGEHTEAARCATEAMPHLPEAGSKWFLAAGIAAESWGKLGERKPLAALAGALLSMQRRPDGPQAIAFVRAAAQLFLIGHGKEAEALVAAVEREPPADARARAFIDHGRSVRALMHGDLGAYRGLKAAAADGFDRAGDRRNSCSQRAKLGYAGLLLGAYPEAERELRAALLQAEKLGLRNVAASARHNLGLVLALQGRLAEAEPLERQAIDEFHQQRDNRLEQASRTYLGHILYLKGALEAAASEIRQAVARAVAASPQRAHALAYLAQIQLAGGHHAGALASAGEAVRMLQEMGGIDEGEALVWLVHAEALHATGAVAEAKDALARAAVRLRERAASISEPHWRECFLTRVAENARTLQLHEEWSRG